MFEQSENPNAVDNEIIEKKDMHLCAGEYAQYCAIQMLTINFLDCVNNQAFSQDDIQQSHATYLMSFDNDPFSDENAFIDIGFSPRTFKKTACNVLLISPGAHDEIAAMNRTEPFDRERDSCFYIAKDLMEKAYKNLTEQELLENENLSVYQMYGKMEHLQEYNDAPGLDKVFSVIGSMAENFIMDRHNSSEIKFSLN